ncbi:hypothetical protein QYE76_056271 [Lolium multiflorum]|uniref:CCHC-type domain-containing protein n=1 Tax=Lolium multiflorum TaxID=4521 RepID=A0AAD8T1A7_LOLMU|nr:hypothetical protein QYE76_056271 [Lolium multiflorum]
MVEEDEKEELASSGSSSQRSYSDVVRGGSPSLVRTASPEVALWRQAWMVLAQDVDLVDAGATAQAAAPLRSAPVLLCAGGMPAGLAGLCFNCAEPGHMAGCFFGPRRCLTCKSKEHVARQCPMSVLPVAGVVAVGAPLSPPRTAPPPPPPPQATPPPPRAAPSTADAAVPAEPAPVAPVAPYRLPAHLRMGARGLGAKARPSIKDRLGEAGADVRRVADVGGS